MSIVDFNQKNLVDHFSNEYSIRKQDDSQYDYIFRYLQKFDCGKILVEEAYVDRDFLDDFSHYYVSCFRPYERYCKRLHFFIDLDEDQFNEVIDGKMKVIDVQHNLQENYLGFIVVKPLPQTIIGRSVLKVYNDTTTEKGDVPDRRSIRCLRSYKVSLFGIDLEIKSLAFQEQDTVVSACATSAIWTALQKSCSTWGFHIPTPYEITTFATRYEHSNRPIPSTGLTLSQMVHGIKEVGLEPQVFDCLDEKTKMITLPLLSVCYSYLRAEIPVILCVDIEGSGHAITITGYKLDETFPEINEYELIEPSMKNFHVKGSRIKKLYAHDDQIGPFSKIDINLNIENRSIEMTTDWTYEDGTPKSVIPYNLIVPIYHKIRLPINPMMKYINMLDNLFKSINIFSDNKRFEWNCYLTNINDYKSEMLNEPQLIDKSGILMSSYPRFFWRFKAIYNDDILFELLADATDMERSFQFININFYSEEVLSIFKGLFNSTNRDFLIKCLTREMHDFIHEEL